MTDSSTPALSDKARRGLRLLTPYPSAAEFGSSKGLVAHPFGLKPIWCANYDKVLLGNPFNYYKAAAQMTTFLQLLMHQSDGLLRIVELPSSPNWPGTKFTCFEAATRHGALLCVADDKTGCTESVDNLYVNRLEHMFAGVAHVLGIDIERVVAESNAGIEMLRTLYDREHGLRNGRELTYGEDRVIADTSITG